MVRLTRKAGYLTFLYFAGAAFGGPMTRVFTVSPLAAIAMPEPSFPLEALLTAAGFAGLLFLFRRIKAGPSRDR
jgi:hypothetical protein